MKYKVRYRRGKADVTIESNDKAYIDKALAALGGEPKKAAKPARKKASAKAKATGRKKTGRKKASSKKTGRKKTGRKKAGHKKASSKKTGRKKTGRKKTGRKKTGRKKAARRSAGKARTASAGGQPNLGRIISAVRGARNAAAIRRNVLGKRDRLARILLCYQFAKSTQQPALSTRDVEALTAKLGGRIAQPNVGKVIRLGGKRYLTAKRGDNGTAYVINARGQQALQRAIRGAELS